MSTTPKEIIFEEQARALLFNGIKQLADTVKFTLSPRGRNVGLEKGWGAPTITNDGSSIVKDVTLKNTYENMGVAMAKEVVQKIKEKCGDGTTTGVILLNALVEHGIKLITAGASPISVKRGMDKAVEQVVKGLEEHAIPVKNNQEIRNIATASASGNSEIGKMISEAMEKVSRSGVITIAEGKSMETTIEIVEGMQFNRGFISTYFCTNAEKQIVEMQNPNILILDRKISSIHEILPVLQQVATTGQQLLIIAEDIDGDALSTLVVNKLRGTLKVCAVKSPGFGDQRKALLQDIAVLSGGLVISEDAGITLNELPENALGKAESVTISKENTLIVKGAGEPANIQARIKQIENEIALTKTTYDIEKLEERKAKLSGGVAIIEVGAVTTPELKQKKQMYEDSLSSTKAAVEEGIVPGGGVALLKACKSIDQLKLEGDEALGAQIVKEACTAPVRQIAVNAGQDGGMILNEIRKSQPNFGFNVLTDKIEDMLTAGIIDPAKVVKNCLIYAASVAGIVLITEALIADAPEEKDEKAS